MNEQTKIVIAGGNGFLGQLLINNFINKGYSVINLNRHQSKTYGNLKLVKWDGRTPGKWANEIEGSDVVINLVGRSVDCRYNEKNKKEIIDSRVYSTKAIGEAIISSGKLPKLWINASSATIYAHSVENKNDESGTIGSGFSVEVCKKWENTARKYRTSETRQVLLRTSMVMGESGGVFPVLSNLVKKGLGGKQGKGNQYVSWIHATDFVRSVEHIMENKELKGTINCTAPTPLENKGFMKILRNEWNVPFGLPASKLMLEIGAFFLSTETELILKSRRVIPGKLEKSNFEFLYPTAEKAIHHLIHPKIN